MSWIPFVLLAKRAVDAYMKYEREQSARFRCRICWTDDHSTEEHEHPQLSPKRQADLVKWMVAVPFLLAVFLGLSARSLGGASVPALVVEWLLIWPAWAWAVAYRFRKAQIRENERFYRRLE